MDGCSWVCDEVLEALREPDLPVGTHVDPVRVAHELAGLAQRGVVAPDEGAAPDVAFG